MRPSLVDPPAPPVTMRGRAILFAQCDQCDWQAKHTGDTEAEVEDFLCRALNQHVLDVHLKGVA